MRHRVFAGLLGIVIVTAAAGCSSETKVGSDRLKNFTSSSAGPRLGEATSTPSTKPSTSATSRTRPSTTAAASPRKTTKPTTKASAGPQVAIAIGINGDSSGKSQFDPSAARIYAGTCAKWTNADVKPRAVVADAGGFSSGTLAPGASYTYCPTSAGHFNYHDGTRPYAVAYLEVLAR